MNAEEVERKSTDILLVEDNPVDVLVTRTAQEESGFDFELHVAEDGEEAWDFLYHHCQMRSNLLHIRRASNSARAICCIRIF